MTVAEIDRMATIASLLAKMEEVGLLLNAIDEQTLPRNVLDQVRVLTAAALNELIKYEERRLAAH